MCLPSEYIIDEQNLSIWDESTGKRYLDVDRINNIPSGSQVLKLKNRDTIFIKSDEELLLKSGWKLIGFTGDEHLTKESSIQNSAIKIVNQQSILIDNFSLSMEKYVNSKYSHGLIDIENEWKSGKAPIIIKRLQLKNHYSAIWIKKGNHIRIDSCHLEGNAHQIQLGHLGVNPVELHKYKVDDVSIKNCKIINSLGGNSNGIKTLSNCTGILIESNLISNNVQDGIDLYPGGVDVIIRNNTIANNTIHGVEVKMYKDYLPAQTGQIKNVIISGNHILNNGNSGILCWDSIGVPYYPTGVSIEENKIDSNGYYGICSFFPVSIQRNILSKNGLQKNLTRPTNPVGYTGILLLNGRPNESYHINGNQIIDQAPIKGINTTYSLTISGILSPVELTGNKFIISNPKDTILSQAKYGLGIVNSKKHVDTSKVIHNNYFSSGFIKNIVVQ